MNCDRSKALVSVYVDGELSEELAGPLRRHLMECAACRASVSEAKALASWFVPSAPISVPEGFAARVTRLATSGAADPGAGISSGATSAAAGGADLLVPSRAAHAPRLGVQSSPAGFQGSPVRAHGEHGHFRSGDRTARFAMSLAAMAAAVLIGLTVLLASRDGRGFDGPAIQAQPSLENALDVLEELNRREAAAAIGETATQPAGQTPAGQTPAAQSPGGGEPNSVTEQPLSPR